MEDHERDTRYFAYQAFILGAFWDENADGINASHQAVAESFRLFLSFSTSSDYDELRCFVRADMPTLPVDLIKSSNRYLTCLAGEV
jgi:hypothetical protein